VLNAPSHLSTSLGRGLNRALFLPCLANAQAPPTIQFFMPDGSLPARQLRFSLESQDGRIVDIFFTDTKGKFLLARSQGLRPNAGYRISIESDGRTFAATTISFYHYGDGVYFVPIFLKALAPETVKPAGLVDLAELDSSVPKEALDAYNLGMRAFNEGRSDEAIKEIGRALKIYPKYFRAIERLGRDSTEAEQTERSSGSLRAGEQACAACLLPAMNLGIIKTRQAKYKDAVALLEQLHKENPTLVEIRVPLADALMAEGQLNQAEPHLRAAASDNRLDRSPSGQAHYLLGLLLNRTERFEEAVKELTIAANVIPNSARTHLQLGGALLQIKKMDEAERELLTAYRLGGAQMAGAQLLLGQMYHEQKKYENALHAFEQYLSDLPRAPNAAELRGVIERIRIALETNK
jgi:tetratricopeptide (TPR) repeat protein